MSNANVFLPRLEEQILLDLAKSMMPCLDRRLLKEGEQKNVLGERILNGEYSVRGIESKPDDVAVKNGECVYEDTFS